MKNKLNRIAKLRKTLLTYVHEQSGRMLTLSRKERKAEIKQARVVKQREKLLKKLQKCEQDFAATTVVVE